MPDSALRTQPRPGLPPIPSRMRPLPIDARGYPVPWFVEWIQGEPDFRVMDRAKWHKAVRFGNCWLCGEKVGVARTFVIGPMCAINRTTSEPPCHLECAEFAVQACPFMILPRAHRREANLPDHPPIPGMHLDRNPGATCLWTTIEYSVFRAEEVSEPGSGAAAGLLIHLGEPRAVSWWACGRRASRDAVMESIDTGLPLLQQAARRQGAGALDALRSQLAVFSRLLPA